MNSKEKIKYLSRYKRLDNEISRLLTEAAQWRNKAGLISPEYSDMPKSKEAKNSIEEAVMHIYEIEADLHAKIRELCRLRRRIDKAIRSVPEPLLRLLLEYRYINGMTWEKIAVEMDYTYQWVCALHGKAINQLIVIDNKPVV